MIIAFIGQPHSGKTTLAEALQRQLFAAYKKSYPIVDGDDIRKIFKNTDYSREGRIRNLNRISDISRFLVDKYDTVLISAVYPLSEAREYLESIYEQVYWVHLTYSDVRGRELFHVKDYEVPGIELKNVITINTTELDIDQSVIKVMQYVAEKTSR